MRNHPWRPNDPRGEGIDDDDDGDAMMMMKQKNKVRTPRIFNTSQSNDEKSTIERVLERVRHDDLAAMMMMLASILGRRRAAPASE